MSTSTTIPEAVAPYVTRAPGYRLPSATTLGVVRLEIADLARSLHYYENVLGLRVLDRTDRRASLAAHGDDTAIIELNEVPGAREHPDHARLGLYHFAILLPTRGDLARFVAHIARLGVQMGAGDHLVSEAFYLRDPDGLGIEVYADRPRDSWAVRDGQLVMGVDPVDVDDLLKSAGDSTWTGMPSGTTIGHVHLHVAHLSDAEAFYHGALGLDKVFRMPSALFLSAGGYHHHLGTNTWAGKAPRPAPGDARLLEWTIILPSATDVSAVEQSLNVAGFSTLRDGDSLLVDDPWGTRIRLSAVT